MPLFLKFCCALSLKITSMRSLDPHCRLRLGEILFLLSHHILLLFFLVLLQLNFRVCLNLTERLLDRKSLLLARYLFRVALLCQSSLFGSPASSQV